MKRLPLAAILAVFFGWLLWSVSVRQAALFSVGLGLGAVLAGKRFGFTTGWRMLIEDKDASGVFGQLLLLALAAALAMPLLGWAMLSAGDYPRPLGLPAIAPHNLQLYAVLRQAHGWAGYLLFATVLVHVGAALMHAWVRRDGVLRSMWPGPLRRSD